MNRTRIVLAGTTLLLAAGVAVPAQAAPVPTRQVVAAEGLCLDLSAVGLASICIGSLL